jgi:hypothetical protein
MEPTGFNPDADTLAPSELRVVAVCDVVESVRWMEQDADSLADCVKSSGLF